MATSVSQFCFYCKCGLLIPVCLASALTSLQRTCAIYVVVSFHNPEVLIVKQFKTLWCHRPWYLILYSDYHFTGDHLQLWDIHSLHLYKGFQLGILQCKLQGPYLPYLDFTKCVKGNVNGEWEKLFTCDRKHNTHLSWADGHF